MAYKTAFRPLESLGRDGWQRFGVPATDATPQVFVERRNLKRLLIDA